MELFDRDGFDLLLGDWAGVSFVDQWDARIAKVGDKVFCLLSDNAPYRIVFKSGETSFDLLTELDGISQAPYFAKRGWVQVFETSPLTQDELLAYIGRSYALVAKGLTRKLRSELGITIDVGGI